MSEPVTISQFLDDLLVSVPKNKWRVVELTVRKNGDRWEVAYGDAFGPFVLKPKIQPEEK